MRKSERGSEGKRVREGVEGVGAACNGGRAVIVALGKVKDKLSQTTLELSGSKRC